MRLDGAASAGNEPDAAKAALGKVMNAMSGSQEKITGTFEPNGRAGGYLRKASENFRIRPGAVAVASDLARKLHLRGGETIVATVQQAAKKSNPALLRVDEIESIGGLSVDDYLDCKPFEELTAIDPESAVRFEIPDGSVSMRVVDLMTPIGLGQRGLIVAAPRTGKTMLLQQMAAGVAHNHPNIYMMVLLIDERPEEVTEMRRTVHGEVIASSNDQDVKNHLRLSRLIAQKAKRMVESGRDVLVLLDSLTRMGRAFNVGLRGGGRTMSGGLDIQALTEPKAIFGAARNVENGGSLTIIASCLIETGSRMDDVIFNEFKGTGNMEIILSREMANRRLWPAIDLPQSGTRREELLLNEQQLAFATSLRRRLTSAPPVGAMESLLEEMGKHACNADMIARLTARGVL